MPQPEIRTGASAILMITASACTIMVGPHDTGTAQRGPHHLRGELQHQRGHEPEQIRRARLDGGLVGGHHPHVTAGERGSCNPGQQPARGRQAERLVEHQIGVGLILAAHGMRNQRDGADAQHLHQRR